MREAEGWFPGICRKAKEEEKKRKVNRVEDYETALRMFIRTTTDR
jgi:hypothetical protein